MQSTEIISDTAKKKIIVLGMAVKINETDILGLKSGQIFYSISLQWNHNISHKYNPHR